MDLERVVEYVRRSEELSLELAQKLKSAFTGGGSAFILYCGCAEGLATHLSSILRIARPQLNVAVFDGDYCHNIVLPYVAENLSIVLLLSSMKGARCMYRTVHALSTLGVRTLSVVPTPMASQLKSHSITSNQKIEVLELERDVYRLALLQAFLRLALELGGRDMPRIKRIEKELSFKEVVKDLVNTYADKIALIRKARYVIVTKSLLAAGEELADRGIPVGVLGKDPMDSEPAVIAYTTVEEHIVNEYLIELARKGFQRAETLTIKLNLDPLTVPIYALTLFYALLLHPLEQTIRR